MLKLKLGDKTYVATTINAAITRETFQINRDALQFAKEALKAQQAEETEDFDLLTDIMDKTLELKDRKAALICKAYGDKFTVDDLENHLTDEEIDLQINSLISSINRKIEKK